MVPTLPSGAQPAYYLANIDLRVVNKHPTAAAPAKSRIAHGPTFCGGQSIAPCHFCILRHDNPQVVAKTTTLGIVAHSTAARREAG